MSSKPILVIKDTDATIGIRARIGEEFSEHEIQLSMMLAYYWENNLPIIENLVDLFETVVKRTINDVIPHKNLYLKYKLSTDSAIENATRFEIQLIEVKADDIDLRLDGKILSLKNIKSDEKSSDDLDGDVELVNSEIVEKTIVTQEKISFKDFAKQQNLKNGL